MMLQNNINQYTLTGFSSATTRSLVDIKKDISGSTVVLTDDLQIALAQQLTVSALECYWDALKKQYEIKLPFPGYPLETKALLRSDVPAPFLELGSALVRLPVE